MEGSISSGASGGMLCIMYIRLDSGHVYDGFLLFLSGPGPPLFSLG